MTAFGSHNYATPFGALTPTGFFNPQGTAFYSYSGFSSRAGVIGFSATVGQFASPPPPGPPVITTFAGKGNVVVSDNGDGGLATSAVLKPRDVAVLGNFVYFADNFLVEPSDPALKIRRIDTLSGIISHVYSSSSTTIANIAVLGDNIYVAERDGNIVRKINSLTLAVNTIAGTGIAGFSGDGGQATAAELNAPASMVFDSLGNLYFLDLNNQRVRKIDAITGAISTYADLSSFALDGSLGVNSDDLFFSSNGDVYKISASTQAITFFAGNTTLGPGFSGDGGAATSAQFGAINKILVFEDAMYLADATLNHRIRKIDLDTGIVTTIAGSSSVGGFGGDGGPPTSALLNQPLSVAFDADGDMYVADFTNFRLRKVAPEDPGESTTEIDACGPSGLEFLPFSPTLTFPLNFAVLQGEATITWKPADPPDPCGDDVTYELQFTRTVSRNSGWKTISSAIPATETQLVFDVSEIPYTQDGGLRIRAKDNKSLFSEFSSSNEPFTIANHAPAPVTLFSPLANDVFDNCMAVVWREAAIKDVDGHSISYQVEMTDRFSKNDGWLIIPGAEALPDGTTTFEINMFDFADGDDYGIRVSAVDELGLSSTPKSIGPIRIKHQGNFIIDTIPPEGSISINDGAALASNTRVKLTLFASDATTGVKDVRFRNAEEDCFGDFDTFVSEKFWDLPKSDGVKRVFVQYRDCADNVSEVCDCEIVSRVLCDAGNAMDIEVFNDKLYVAFDANGNLVEYKVLVKRAAELAEPELTALAKFKNFLYIATYDPASGAAIYAFDGRATLSFSLAGVKVLTMQAYNEKLFLGLDDGKIKSFDEMSVATVFAGLKAVTRLRTDGAVLYASLRGAGEYLTTVDGIFWKVNPL